LTYSPVSGPPYDVYALALAGAMGGLSARRAQASPSPATYAPQAAYADAWAQAFDAAWGDAAALDELQAVLIWEGSYGYWATSERLGAAGWAGPSAAAPAAGPAPSQFTRAVDAVIAAITAAEDQAEAEGIVVPGWRQELPTSFVFRPGGTPGGNVFTDEGDLAAATRALGGAPYAVAFDLSLVADHYNLATVGPWLVAPNGTWTSWAGQAMVLEFTNGTTIPAGCMPTLAGNLRVKVIQAEAVYAADLDAYEEYAVRESATVYQDTVGAGAWIANTGSAYGAVVLYDLAQLGQLGAPAGTALVNHADVALESSASAFAGAVNLSDGSRVFVHSADYLDPALYPAVAYVNGLLPDPSGTAASVIPPASGRPGSLISDPVHGVLYQCNATSTAWVAIG